MHLIIGYTITLGGGLHVVQKRIEILFKYNIIQASIQSVMCC